MKIIKNFIQDKETFNNIKDTLMGCEFPYYYFDCVSESDTPLAVNGKFYEIDDVLLVDATIQISRASSNPGTIYVKHNQIEIANTKSLIIANGEELVIDAYQFS